MENGIGSYIKNYKVRLVNIINDNTNLNFINSFVDKIFVINMKSCNIRRNYIISLMKKYNINFTFVIVDSISYDVTKYINKFTTLTKAETGCLISHLWCLNRIIKQKYKNAIIFEDDIIFHKNFSVIFPKVFENTNRIDFLILGACDFHFSEENFKRVDKNKNLYTITSETPRVYGAHANYYSYEGALKMFKLKINNISFFDRDYCKMFEYFENSSFICYPNLVVSDISTTNLHHKYKFFSKAEEEYYTKCFINFNFKKYNFIYLDLVEKCKNININDFDNYENYITKIIRYNFYDNEYVNILKDRLVMNFFNLNDIKFILNYNLIDPNILSKK